MGQSITRYNRHGDCFLRASPDGEPVHWPRVACLAHSYVTMTAVGKDPHRKSPIALRRAHVRRLRRWREAYDEQSYCRRYAWARCSIRPM